MELYAGTSEKFVADTIQNQIADKLLAQFENYYGRRPSTSEVTSWRNSLQYMKNVIEYNSLYGNFVILEHELPYSTERIDFIIFGKSETGKEMIVVIEIKQWEKVKDCDIDNNVITFVGGSERMQAHPSFQVRGYAFYLKDFVEVLHNDAIVLEACVYCHNYSRKKENVLFYPKFKEIETQFPVFAKEDFEHLGKYLKSKLSQGKGLEIFNRFSKSKICPSKKLIDVTKKMIEGQSVFNLVE